ncbi:allantoicase [Blastococcus haudaquaticus]|uniref:Probable allantoicase n=1 Tax=Blastococcus haudaquaticus TaxID=1938745 RepID=A0A286GWV6_9ACTN|nr:allantoicase [Blastococcus haudaquaticus]SOE00018.1 allantoicase [Blastococcus haudaquaticus]
MSDFTRLPDLASRALGGAVVAANDESFAERENLVLPAAPVARTEFGPKGKVYDGWETRRRRTPGHDWAVVRLATPGIVAGAVVDTAFFTGNYPPQASLDGAAIEGHCSVDELLKADWQPLLPVHGLAGNTHNVFPVHSGRRVTHVRLNIHPDGGVARLRVHGHAVPDPRLLDAGPVDLAALENGALISGVSNEFYGRPEQLIAPGLARSMGEGWETARRRDSGNDWVEVTLACEGVVTLAELDTSWFLHNAPGTAALIGIGPDGEVPVLPRTRLQPDTRHRFVLDGAPAVEKVRLDVHPDGGMARLRLWGRPTARGRAALGRRWFDALPDLQALEVLGSIGVPPETAGRLVGARPTTGDLPAAVARLVDGAPA